MSGGAEAPFAVEARQSAATNGHASKVGDPAVTTLALVVDRVAYGQLLASALNNESGLGCVAVASTGGEVIAAVADPPAVVVVEGSKDTLNQDALAQLRGAWPETKLVVLTDMADPASTISFVHAGAAALLPREAPLDEIVATIRSVGDGMLLMSKSTLRATRAKLRGEPTPSKPYRFELTPRETDVLRALAKGQPLAAIARSLGITISTCRGHLKGAMTKLGAHSQLEVVVFAARAGLLGSEQPTTTP